jgi:ferredoxin
MKVWIDQDLCTGDGLCEEIAPDVFTLLDDGLAYVREGAKVYATAKGNPQGAGQPARRRDRIGRRVSRRVHFHRALIHQGPWPTRPHRTSGRV